MLEDCPDARQEALLAVKWAEPTILREKLREMYAAGGGAKEAEPSSPGPARALSADELRSVKELQENPTTNRQLVRVQSAFRGFVARRKAGAIKAEQASLLQIALQGADLSVVNVLLEYTGAAPEAFRLDDLFTMSHNRYPIQDSYQDVAVNDLWQVRMPKHSSLPRMCRSF